MSGERIGDIARKYYRSWHLRQLSLMEHQEKNLCTHLLPLKSYMMNEILEDSMSGAKFRRFFYNELNTVTRLDRQIYNYDVGIMLKDENLDVVYEKDSFIVHWSKELK